MLRSPALFSVRFKRFMSTSKYSLEQLNNRKLIRISGQEAPNYLQGLITNDMKHLTKGPGSMFAMFLNNKGRILYDTIIYRPSEDDTNNYLIECDNEALQSLERHLKMYRVRRKIDVSIDTENQLFTLFSNDFDKDNFSNLISKSNDDILVFKDPRIAELGLRIIAKVGMVVGEQFPEIRLENDQTYRCLRYKLGVGEGVLELPPNTSFPLECNCDYLHGVSFHKGCYVGQELTARVHHTGVVRKRLMPISFSNVPSKMPEESVVFEGENLGKFRGFEGDVGLGLFRIDKVLKFKEIAIGDGVASVFKPNWWPREAYKQTEALNA